MRAAGLLGNGNINVLAASRNVDDACIGATSVPGIPFDDMVVAVVLNGRSPTLEVEVIIPALGIVGSQVRGEDQRLPGKDGHEEAVARDSGLEEVD